ncbi:MAG TPA: protein kinase [Gemmatimonadales bacterium]
MKPVSADRLAALDALLRQALELEEPEREAWLARLRRDQPAQASELEALLAESPRLEAAGFLSREGTGHAGLDGRQLGAYTLERPLGRGGMGTVWLARRSDGRYEGHAAVKLPNLALLDPVGSERFRREGTLLARLSHPNIARLLDAGVADGGQPFLVLEYVEGTRIDRYCDERQLPPEARLRLFLDVLGAVSHAHANLIVHRDLKPSNILVTRDGTVKLLDFGIAKLLQDGRSEAGDSTLTDAGGRVLTPEYAAPEQIRGEPVTIATDVYALGVLLYLLLAGRHPTVEPGRSPAEYLQGVLETEPPRLSTVRRQYAGDLDTIVAKALRKRPDERYATVGELADDLRRHLNHEPVLARPESWSYRSARFIRRHRAAVAAAAVAALSLVGATAFSLVQLREARRQRDAAVAESRRRQAMADVQGVLAGDTRGAGGRTLSVLERIELAEGMLRRKYQAQPAVVVEVMAQLSARLFDMNDMEGHRRVLGRALALARTAGLPAHVALVNCLRVLSLTYDDQLDSARAALAEARVQEAGAGPLPREVEVQCLDAEGQLLVAGGRPDSAVRVLRRAVELTPEPGVMQGLESRNDLAAALRAAGQTREATRVQQGILARLDSTGYTDTDVYPTVLAFLGAALAELGEFRALDSITGGFIRGVEATYGRGAVDGRVVALYGINKLREGDLDSAAVWLAAAARDTSQTSRLVTAMWLPPAEMQLRLEQGRLADARRAAATLARDTPTRRITAAWLLARLRRAEGNPAGARAMLDSALVAEHAAETPSPRLVYALLTAAEWRREGGDLRGADSLAGLAIRAAALDSLAFSRSAHVGRAELVRARVALARGDSAAALQAADRAARALANGFGPGHPLAVEARGLRRRRRRQRRARPPGRSPGATAPASSPGRSRSPR